MIGRELVENVLDEEFVVFKTPAGFEIHYCPTKAFVSHHAMMHNHEFLHKQAELIKRDAEREMFSKVLGSLLGEKDSVVFRDKKVVVTPLTTETVILMHPVQYDEILKSSEFDCFMLAKGDHEVRLHNITGGRE